MFESVLERNLPPRQLGRGAGLAVGVHAAVIAAALYFSARPARVVEKPMGPLTIFAQPSRIAQPDSVRTGGGTPAERSRSEHRPVRTIPVDADKNKRRTQDSVSSAGVTADSGHATPHSGSSAAEGPGTTGSKGEGAGSGMGGGATIAIPFGEGMTRPTPITQPPPIYTREASAARSQGMVSVRCVITVEGTLKDCRIIQGVPFMNTAVLEALSRWRYSPVTFQGRPVSVYYAINLRLVAP